MAIERPRGAGRLRQLGHRVRAAPSWHDHPLDVLRTGTDSYATDAEAAVEGGANVVSEAIAAGTPVLCSAIPGNLGLLGAHWPATFPPGDPAALAALLVRAATEVAWLDDLRARITALQPMVCPARERSALGGLLAALATGG